VHVTKNDRFETRDCLEFEGSEYRRRWQRLRENASTLADAVLVCSPEALRYLCGYRSLLTRSKWRPIMLCVPAQEESEPFLCVPGQELGIAQAYTPIDDLWLARESVVHGHDDPMDVVADALKSRSLDQGRIGIEAGFGQRLGATLDEIERLRHRLPKATFVDAAPALWATRAVKSEAEVACLRRACELSCSGVRAGFEQLQAGMTEKQLHRIMVHAMMEAGAEDVWLAVGSGAKGYGIFNSLPTDHQLRRGDLVWVDGGAYFQGYVCDFIRSAVVGEPSSEQETWYSAALDANRAALEAVGPGIESRELFAKALKSLEAIGMGDTWGLDVLGHGVGLEIHELPSLTQNSSEHLVPGHVVTIEPSLSPPRHSHGHYIVEEIVAVTQSGQDILTSSLSPELWVTGR